MEKAEILNWLQEEYQNWEGLLDQIGQEWMEQPGVNGDWSMKDIVAHLTGWQPRVNAHLQAALRGEPEPPPPWPRTCKLTMRTMRGSMSPIADARCVKSLRGRAGYFRNSSTWWKDYPRMSRSNKCSRGLGSIILCGWAISASNPGSSLTISMMIMSQISVPGWPESEANNSPVGVSI